MSRRPVVDSELDPGATARWGRSHDLLTQEATMSRLESIESQIQQLSPEELVALREWFAAYDAEVWDRQFEDDVHAGKLDALAERALRDHQAGRSTKL